MEHFDRSYTTSDQSVKYGSISNHFYICDIEEYQDLEIQVKGNAAVPVAPDNNGFTYLLTHPANLCPICK